MNPNERKPAHVPGDVIVTVRDLCKHFGPVTALRSVDLTVRRGQVLGLVGENGSGKSTVTSILAGMQKPDSGRMTFRGEPWHPDTMHEALAGGIGMIVQESGTVPGITAAENLFLSDVGRFRAGGLISGRALRRAARAALDEVGAHHIPEDAVTGTLDPADRKLIEVAKVVAQRPDVVIVDETTTALSQTGRGILYDLMDRMAREGKAVIFISHDLDELTAVCDVMTVLRDGVIIRSFEKSEFDPDAIRQSMIGRTLVGHYYRPDTPPPPVGRTVLSAEHISLDGVLRDVTLDAHEGEILGIGGLSQCGMHALGKVLFGAIRPDAGTVTVRGRAVRSPSDAMRCRVGYTAKDRDAESLCPDASIGDNIASAAAAVRLPAVMAGPFMPPGRERRYVGRLIGQMQVKCTGQAQPVSQLSGGNKQKVVFAKWIGVGSEVLILDCPTRGIDVGVKQAMYGLLYKMKCDGRTVVMISEELPELLGMSDRLLIMKNGRVTGEFKRSPDLGEADVIGCMV